MMNSTDDRRDRLSSFFEEIAAVMERHGDIARQFVLAEADPSDMEEAAPVLPSEETSPFAMAAEAALTSQAAARRRVCIRFGIDPRTGRRVCLQWVDMR